MSDPLELGKFEFVRLASLRAAQLIKGCTARVPMGGKHTTTARSEVTAGKVIALPREPIAPGSIRR
jgi:DNA-directed RNA polymerase subunit K/omega